MPWGFPGLGQGLGQHLDVGPKQHIVSDCDGCAVQQAAVEVHVHALPDGHVVALRNRLPRSRRKPENLPVAVIAMYHG